MTPLLEARDLAYAIDGRTVFSGVSLTVDAGERLAVVGPSGSGKTSLLACLTGLVTPTAGEVLLQGEPVRGLAGPSRGVAMVLQGYGLVSLLSAAENIEVAVRAAGTRPSDARRVARQALAAVGLTPHADQLVDELSGGQQQRTAVARALALGPRLLVADEPTAELDPASRVLAVARMLEVTERGGALVLATHDPDVAASCHHVLDLHVTAARSG